MDKKSFLNHIDYEDKNALSNLYDKIQLAEKISRPVFTNEFYPPNVWKTINAMKNIMGISVYTNGIFEDSERRVMAFSTEGIDFYPILLMRIENKSRFQELQHRDYLGAIMSLGIKREKFGDLIVNENSCYAAVCEDIFDYIRDNLTTIGKCPCKVEKMQALNLENISPRFERMAIHSTSLRLDCLISSICNVSRTKAVDLIQAGKVLIDYSEALEKDKTVEEGTVITIRGFGKYKLEEQNGSTQRGRLKLSLKKYI